MKDNTYENYADLAKHGNAPQEPHDEWGRGSANDFYEMIKCNFTDTQRDIISEAVRSFTSPNNPVYDVEEIRQIMKELWKDKRNV